MLTGCVFLHVVVLQLTVNAHSKPGGTESKCTMPWQIAPTEDEAAALRKYDGPFDDLSRPEQHLSVLATVPRLRSKLQCTLFRRQADGLCADAEAGLRTVQSACRQV